MARSCPPLDRVGVAGLSRLWSRRTRTGRSQCSISFRETLPSRRERSPEIPCEPTTTTAAPRSRAMPISASATSTSSGTACGSAASPRERANSAPSPATLEACSRWQAIDRFDRRRIRGSDPPPWRRVGPPVPQPARAPRPSPAQPGARRRARLRAERRPGKPPNRRRRSGPVPSRGHARRAYSARPLHRPIRMRRAMGPAVMLRWWPLE